MIQALPLVLILFVFLPRSRQQFLMQFSQPLLGSSGMSDRLSPGSIASLALNQEVVFRADFPDGNVPSMSQMYWRAGILWHGDGLTWTRGPQMTPERRVGQLTGPLVRQRIILQPHGLRWLYALDRPAAVEARGAHFEAGGILQSNRPVLKRMQYDVFSRPENREVILPADQRVETLRLPAHTSPDVVALVRGWRTAHPADRALVEAALQYFRTERFVYTLEPGTYESADPLRDFLFERRAGFCEHYAAAYATLMRLAGIPSRVVIGYHGGEYNSLGKYVMVRQSDAHAWCEVWIKGEGWLRVDPTDVIAPDRLTSGLDTFLQTRAGANQPANQSSSAVTGWRDLQREARLAWDNLNHQWDLRVLGFDEENQRTFLASFGFGDFKWIDFLVWMVTPSALILGLVGLWLRRPGRSPSDPIVRTYARFCQRLASAGLPREPAEGPHHYGERAATHFPAAAAQIRAIIALYTALRYSPTPPAPALLRRALRALPRRLRTEPAS
jgi:transglutaminase-like putative cysteine protease